MIRAVQKEIANEGGTIEHVGIIGLMIRSPFRALAVSPVYVKVACRYPHDTGHWYICESESGDMQWAWKSTEGNTDHPVQRDYEVKVDNSVLTLPAWLSVVLFILLMFTIITGPLWVLL